MNAIFVSLLALAFVGLAGPGPSALAESPKAETGDAELAKCSLKRAQCRDVVRICLDTGDELSCRQAQQVCERVDPRCPQ